jgi:hypothetical protein
MEISFIDDEELYGNELDASRPLSSDGKERLKKFLKNHLD